MNNLLDRTLGDIVAEDFRTAAVFDHFQLDFCCGGQQTLRQTCARQLLQESVILEALLETRLQPAVGQHDFRSWPLDLLCDYIEKTHHRYVREKGPELLRYLDKIASVHGANHPELREVAQLFRESNQDLQHHLAKEEAILFPWIRKMEAAKISHAAPGIPVFGKVENPVRVMLQEHDAEGARFRKMSALTHGFAIPADACSTYQTAFKLLREFEQDLHQHIHLENNILFPGAAELEKSFA